MFIYIYEKSACVYIYIYMYIYIHFYSPLTGPYKPFPRTLGQAIASASHFPTAPSKFKDRRRSVCPGLQLIAGLGFWDLGFRV